MVVIRLPSRRWLVVWLAHLATNCNGYVNSCFACQNILVGTYCLPIGSLLLMYLAHPCRKFHTSYCFCSFSGIQTAFSLKLNMWIVQTHDELLDDVLSRSLRSSLVLLSSRFWIAFDFFLHLSQLNLMSIAFVLFGCIVFVTTLKAVVLSIWIGIGGWGCPISSRRCLCGIASLEFM